MAGGERFYFVIQNYDHERRVDTDQLGTCVAIF